jgi:hypothetical protein
MKHQVEATVSQLLAANPGASDDVHARLERQLEGMNFDSAAVKVASLMLHSPSGSPQ